jgi:hypothetical protein
VIEEEDVGKCSDSTPIGDQNERSQAVRPPHLAFLLDASASRKLIHRLAKEEITDTKEAEDRLADLEKMKASDRDGADIRNAVCLAPVTFAAKGKLMSRNEYSRTQSR